MSMRLTREAFAHPGYFPKLDGAKAINGKHQKGIEKALIWSRVVDYFVDQAARAEDIGDEKTERRMLQKEEQAFNRYQGYFEALPKREKSIVIKAYEEV